MICCRPPLDTVWFKRGRSILILLFCTGLWLGTNSSSQSGLLDLVDCPKSDALLRFLRICSNAQGQFSKDNPANVGSFLIGHMMVWFWLILLSKSPCRARTYCPKKTPRILRDDPSSSQPSICANTHSSHIWSHLDHTLSMARIGPLGNSDLSDKMDSDSLSYLDVLQIRYKIAWRKTFHPGSCVEGCAESLAVLRHDHSRSSMSTNHLRSRNVISQIAPGTGQGRS